MSFSAERSKLWKIVDDLRSEQEELQLNDWIQHCAKKEMEESDLYGLCSPLASEARINNDCDYRNQEAALSLKLEGNVHFQLKDYKLAIAVYKRAISCKPSDQELLALLFNNLSAAHFYLNHYSNSLYNCNEALRIKPTYEKVLARKTLCLQKLRESYDAINSTKKNYNTTGKSNKILSSGPGIQNRKMNETEERGNNRLLIKMIRQRNYQFGSGKIDLANLTPILPQLNDHRVSLVQRRLIWPSCFFFPDFRQNVLVEQFDEEKSLQAVICRMPPFNLDWCKYLPEFLQVYFFDQQDNFIPVDMTKTLKEILSLESYVIQHGTPDFAVFVKGGKQEIVFVGAANLIESDFGNEERLKLRKVFDGFISDQEEHQLENWIHKCFEKEAEEAGSFTATNPAYFCEVSPLLELGGVVNSIFHSLDEYRNQTSLSAKLKGNGFFQQKNFRCAALVYQSAILISPSDQELLALLYNNLAAALFNLKYYATSLRYCEDGLKIKPNYEKVSARKVQCLEKLRESHDASPWTEKVIATMLLFELISVCVSNARIQSKEINKTGERMNNILLIETIRQRNYRFDGGKIDLVELTPSQETLKDHRVSLIQGRLIWPTCFAFPDFGRSYLIQQFEEDERIEDVICDLLSLNVDCCKYLPEFLQTYYSTDQQMVPFDIKQTLKEVLSSENYVILNGTPDFIVFMKGGKQEMLFTKHFVG